MAVFRRQALVQFAQFVAGPGMIEKVNEKVDLPRARMAEVALANRPAGPLAEELEASDRSRAMRPVPSLARAAQYFAVAAWRASGTSLRPEPQEPPPEPDEDEGHDIERARLIAFDEDGPAILGAL